MVKRPRRNTRASHEVGYGKPPKHTQFKPGTSGNPNGRPKGSLNIATVLERTLREPVVVNENGRRRTITKLDAAVKQLTNKAAAGDPRAIKFLIDLALVVEGRFEAPSATAADLPEADRQIMTRILGRLQKITKGGANEDPHA